MNTDVQKEFDANFANSREFKSNPFQFALIREIGVTSLPVSIRVDPWLNLSSTNDSTCLSTQLTNTTCW